MLAMLGWPEIIGILVVVLILFGAKKLPELAKGLGQGIKEFKKASSDMQNELHRSVAEAPIRSAAEAGSAARRSRRPLRQEPAGNLRQDPKAKA